MATKSYQILVVDDEPHLRNGLRRILEKEGFTVTTASDGKMALEAAKEQEPDVAILDIMMPGMDGREVCQKLREISTNTQVIYLTAKAEPTGQEQSKQSCGKADAFIVKPATGKQILVKVNSLLRNSHKHRMKPIVV